VTRGRSASVGADRAGVVYIVVSAVCFGTLAIFGKYAERAGVSLLELLALRFGLAAVVLWSIAVARGERLWWGRRTAGPVVMGALYSAQAAAYFASLRSVPAAVTSILLYVYPVIVMLLAALLLGEPLGRVRLGALCLAIVGVFAVINPLGAHGALDGPGVLFGLLTAAVYATYILVGRVLLRDVPAVVATAVVATVAALVLGAAGAAGGSLHPLGADGWALVAAMAVVATAIPATCFLAGLARIGATRAAIISTLEPTTTAVLAALVLGEGLGPVQLAGGVVVLVAAVIVALNVPADLAEPSVRD
jgi:drug/metabolite transporter (DMT)-like permease